MRSRGPSLTNQQQRVAALIAQGVATHQIAKTLGISPKTASGHVSAVLAFMKRRGAQEVGERPRLSAREAQVADLVAAGATDAEIAAALGISLRTAEDHVYRIRKKFGVRSRGEIGGRLG